MLGIVRWLGVNLNYAKKGFTSTGKGSCGGRSKSMERRPRDFGSPAQQRVKNKAPILREGQ